jgi:hypothetical protein
MAFMLQMVPNDQHLLRRKFKALESTNQQNFYLLVKERFT